MTLIKKMLSLFIFNAIILGSVKCALIHNNIFLNSNSPQLLPTPSPLALECLTSIESHVIGCRDEAITDWNITKTSPLNDMCCAQWELSDCDINAAKTFCTNENLDEVIKYFAELVEYYDTSICHQYPKESAHCILPIMSQLSDNKPPVIPPLCVDCLVNIKIEVRKYCQILAIIKWNVTRRAPIRNICCASWDNIDCLDQVLNIRCPPKEINVTENYFKQLEVWAAKESCGQASYHSKNCTISDSIGSEQTGNSYILSPEKSDDINNINKDYLYFLLNYITSTFPHLMHLMILLAIILITVVIIQCFLIAHQVRQDRIIASIKPTVEGYQKLNA